MSWNRRCATMAGPGWLVLMLVTGACAQTPGVAPAVPDTVRVVDAAPEGTLDPNEEVLRQIQDPSTGDLWLLLRNRNRAGGPGQLVLARQRSSTEKAAFGGTMQSSPSGERPVIRAGNALTVEEHTAVVDTRLEAVALESAVTGARFKARLRVGGKVVRVEAISPGRAEFAPESEVAP